MPGAQWFPGARLNYAEHVLPRPRRRRARDPARLRAARRWREWTWGELRAQTGADPRPACVALGVGRGRPRRRLPAEHPRDDRGVPGRRRRSARSGRAARRSSARARSSTASRRSSRRCCSPSTATATAASDFDRSDDGRRRSPREMPALEHVVRFGYLDGTGWEDGLPRRRTRRSSSRACPFDHPLWVLYSLGHDRAAEGDRPRPGRDPARAPQEAAPAPRRAGRRPRLLVHHDRLDDVELPRRRAADRRRRSCSTTATPATRTSDVLWDLAAGDRHDDVRHERRATSPRA